LVAFELAGGLGDFCGGVFDVLGLIEDDEAEVVFFEFFDVALEDGEGGDDDVGVGDVWVEAAALRALEDEGSKGGGEFADFGEPIGDDGGGGDDQGGTGFVGVGVGEMEDVGESLESFSEAHVIGQDAVEVIVREGLHPFDSGLLVGAKGGLEAFGRLIVGGLGFGAGDAGSEFFELGWGIDGERGLFGEGGGVDGMKRGFLGVGEGGEMVEDGAEATGGDFEGAAAVGVGEVDEVGVVVCEVVELIEGVRVEEADEDGEEIEFFSGEIDAYGELEPASR